MNLTLMLLMDSTFFDRSFIADFYLPIYELQLTSYELLFIVRVTSYFLHTSYELLFIAQIMSYFLHTTFQLLLIARVTS